MASRAGVLASHLLKRCLPPSKKHASFQATRTGPTLGVLFFLHGVGVSLFKSASLVSLLTLASRVLGLVRELLIASMFGASQFTDAFNVAFRIPNLFRRLFAEGAFSQAFVPVLAATREQEGDAATRTMLSRVATVLFWVLVLFCLAGVIGAPLLVWAIASGLKRHPEGYAAAVVMTRWIFPYIGFMSLVALAAGVLNTWKRFAVPAISPVFLNITMILSAWLGAPLFARWGLQPVYALCLGVMAGGVLQLGAQLLAHHAGLHVLGHGRCVYPRPEREFARIVQTLSLRLQRIAVLCYARFMGGHSRRTGFLLVD